eukprot:TRINITY_DN37834_c0_g1_i1.p1 TRINITY_DN37834_c0_g1~~TRINITY_DN37834_c0_g1_i1.p1  ORF type:complete len:166 (+),score=49.87 TRINITY_DN37834_c0_g1_i1:127-624(+)
MCIRDSFGSPQKGAQGGDEIKILQGRIRELERANAQNISENHRLEDRLNEAEGLLVDFRQNNKKLQQEDRGDSASNDAKYVIRLLQSEVRDLKEQIADQQRDGDVENERLRRKIEVLSSKRADASLLAVSYTHLRAHETPEHLVCRLLLEKKKKKSAEYIQIKPV